MTDPKSMLSPGIRGWLILVAVLLFGAPGNFLSHAHSSAKQLDAPIVHALTDPTSSTYDARWVSLVHAETTCFSILGCFGMLVLWPLFLFKHRYFPVTYVGALLLVASLLATRAVLVAVIPTVAELRPTTYTQAALWIPVTLALAVYVVRSRRSHITFRHRLMFYPVFPFFTRG